MNSLTDTIMFREMDKKFKLVRILKDKEVFTTYAIPKQLIDEHIFEIRNYRYSMTKDIVEKLKDGDIRFLLFEDPPNKKDMVLIFPYMIYVFLREEKTNRTIIPYVNVSMKGSFERDNTPEKNPERLKLNDIDFYAYAMSGFLSTRLVEEAPKIEKDIKLQKLLGVSYSSMVAKAIDTKFSLSRKSEGFSVLLYILANYFFQFMCKMPPKKASDVALGLPNVDSAVVTNMFTPLRNESYVEIKSINDAIEMIVAFFSSSVKMQLNYRILLSLYTQYYGNISSITLEHYFSFVNMLMNVFINSNFFNDKLIKKVVTQKTLADIDKALYLILK